MLISLVPEISIAFILLTPFEVAAGIIFRGYGPALGGTVEYNLYSNPADRCQGSLNRFKPAKNYVKIVVHRSYVDINQQWGSLFYYSAAEIVLHHVRQ